MSLFDKPFRRLDMRPYQHEFVDAVTKAWGEHQKVLAVLATGGGKTACAGEIAARVVEQGGDVLVLAHTRKLVTQFCHALRNDYGILADVEMGTKKADKNARVICASVQSMQSRVGIGGKFSGRKFNSVFIDEAHRALAKGYAKITQAYPDAKYLGLTATPRRGDQKDLLTFFDYKAVDIPLSRLIREGWLSPLKIKNAGINIRLEKKGEGDFSEAEIAHAIEPYLDALADCYAEHGVGRCGLVFLPLIEISRKFTLKLIERGLRAAHLDGTDSSSSVIDETISALEAGEIDVICNSMLLTEGVDIRPVDLIMNLRPTRSWTLYVQIAGRGTRLFDQSHIDEIVARRGACKWSIKRGCTLLDPLWLCDSHNLLQRPATLISNSAEEEESIDAEFKKSGGSGDLLEKSNDAAQSRHDSLIKRLEAAQKKKDRQMDAMEFFCHIGDMEGAEYEPIGRFDFAGLSQATRDMLLRNDINPETVAGPQHAQRLIAAIIERRKNGLASVKQCKWAAKEGMKGAWTSSASDVSSYLSAIKSGSLDPMEIIV